MFFANTKYRGLNKFQKSIQKLMDEKLDLIKEYKSKYNFSVSIIEKIKVVEGNTVEEFQDNYIKVKSELNKRLIIELFSKSYLLDGSILNLNCYEPNYSNGKYFVVFKYEEYKLNGDIPKDKYIEMANRINEIDEKINNLKENFYISI